MITIWREYGLIAILLVVAIGGYFWLSKSEDDVLAKAMAQVSEHLVSLVPEEADKEQTRRELEGLSDRIESRQIAPAQLERLTASVLNLQSSGVQLDGEEASMVVQMALGGAIDIEGMAALPEASAALALGESAQTNDSRPDLPTPAKVETISRADLASVARRMERVMMVYEGVVDVAPVDSAIRSMPSVQFDTEGGLRVVMDDRLRSEIERSSRFAEAREARVIEWRPRLAEEVRSRRERVVAEAEALRALAASVPDSVEGYRVIEQALASLMRLESRGMISHPDMDSLAERMKRQLETHLARDLGAARVEIRTGETRVGAGS